MRGVLMASRPYPTIAHDWPVQGPGWAYDMIRCDHPSMGVCVCLVLSLANDSYLKVGASAVVYS